MVDIAREIVDYLNKQDKPYSALDIRKFYDFEDAVFPSIAVSEGSISDNLVYGLTTKLQNISVVIEIYGKPLTNDNGEVENGDEVIYKIMNWLDLHIKKQFGMTLSGTTPLSRWSTDNTKVRAVVRYKGIVSNDNIIYK